MEWSFPWRSVDGDREYDDSDFAQFYASLFTNGISLVSADSLKVSTNPTGGMRIQVASGAAVIGGRIYFNSNPIALPINIASGTQERIDSIVVRMDTGLRSIKLVVKSGSTVLTRSKDIFELQVATIRVPRNASNITADLITDTRANDEVCGYSTPYEKVSVSGLEEQYQARLQQTFEEFTLVAEENHSSLEQLLVDQESIFDQQTAIIQTWYENLQNELDEHQAINLQNQITTLTADQEIITITHNLQDYPQAVVTAWEGDEAPVTISAVVNYPNLNEIIVKVPLTSKMLEPEILEVSPFNYLLTEGNKSLRIKVYQSRADYPAEIIIESSEQQFVSQDEKNKLETIEESAQVNRPIATKAQAETGTMNDVSMTPLRTKESIAKNAMIVVAHGDDPDVERPIGALAVYWIGTVRPVNAQDGDLRIGGDD